MKIAVYHNLPSGGAKRAQTNLAGILEQGVPAVAWTDLFQGLLVAGALIGGFGTFLVEQADGQCQYRNSRGQVYTTRCHWL